MKYALVKFRVHLLGSKPFVVYTDHASLRTATQSPHLSQRMALVVILCRIQLYGCVQTGQVECTCRRAVASSRL